MGPEGVFNEEDSLCYNFALIKHSVFRQEAAVIGVTRNRWCKTQSVLCESGRNFMCIGKDTGNFVLRKKTA